MTIQQSRLKKRISRRDLDANKNALKNQKKSRLLVITLLISLRKKRSMTPVKLHVLTVIRKVTILATIPSQKTSMGLDNLCTNN